VRALTRTALALMVIVGWVLALVWLAVSVSQIAVEHTVVKNCVVHHQSPQGDACWD
jgi:hypothetical protein